MWTYVISVSYRVWNLCIIQLHQSFISSSIYTQLVRNMFWSSGNTDSVFDTVARAHSIVQRWACHFPTSISITYPKEHFHHARLSYRYLLDDNWWQSRLIYTSGLSFSISPANSGWNHSCIFTRLSRLSLYPSPWDFNWVHSSLSIHLVLRKSDSPRNNAHDRL